MTLRLRPHHLLCILTYIGKGYSPAFTANLTAISERIAAGEGMEIVEGPDDICEPLLGGQEPHCHRPSANARDVAAADEIGKLLARPVRLGDRLVLDRALLARLRAAFSAENIRSACAGCEWKALCTTVATTEYAGAIISVRSEREGL